MRKREGNKGSRGGGGVDHAYGKEAFKKRWNATVLGGFEKGRSEEQSEVDEEFRTLEGLDWVKSAALGGKGVQKGD